MDKEDRVLAVGRDLAELQQRYGQKAQRRFMDQQGGDWNRDGELDWQFGELPVSVPTRSGSMAWPALVDQQDSVGLRLFESAQDAGYAHLEGVRRLVAIGLRDKMLYLEKHHAIDQVALMVWSSFGSTAQLLRDLAWSCLCAVADQQAGAVRNQQSFDDLLDSTRSALGGEFISRAVALQKVLESTAQIKRVLDAGLAARRPEVHEDISTQLEDMLYEGFLRDLEPDRFAHYPRYLEAIKKRLESQELDPVRDARLMTQVREYWQQYCNLIASGAEYDEHLDHYRWLLEEYRVSLFAQNLGTAQKTSAKKLNEAWKMVTSAS